MDSGAIAAEYVMLICRMSNGVFQIERVAIAGDTKLARRAGP